jgi:di- and tripeptidase
MAEPAEHNDGNMHVDGDPQAAAGADPTPVLSHRMRHDKSILALAVSDRYIFAGTQGGEILVG